MSMEIHVFFHGELPTREKITATMQELGFAFAIAPWEEPLDEQTGFMPMTYQGRPTGCEFYAWTGRQVLEEVVGDFASDAFRPQFDRSANFVWSSSMAEAAAAYCAAAALAKITDGVLFDDDAQFFSAEEAVNEARAVLEDASDELEKGE